MRLKLFTTAAAVMLATPTIAQDYGVEAGISTLGGFIAPTYTVNDRFSLRAPLYFGAVSRDLEFEGETFDSNLNVLSGALMGDFLVASTNRSDFRASLGVAIGGYDISTSTDTLTLEGNTFNTDLELTVAQASAIAPVVALGYKYKLKSGLGFFAEVGAKLVKMEASATGQDALPAADLADFEDQLERVNDEFGALPAIPFVSLGISYKF